MTTPTSSSALPAKTVTALQKALSAEHAAVWIYGLVSAFLPGSFTSAINAGMAAHAKYRDATERLLSGAGVTPQPNAPAYATPQPVKDQASALAVLIAAESDATAAWRFVLENASDQDTRKAALAALTDCAVRGVRWQKATGNPVTLTALPGQG